jgi:hypothetical protein
MVEPEKDLFRTVDNALDGFHHLRQQYGLLGAGSIVVLIALGVVWWNWDEIIKRPGVRWIVESIEEGSPPVPSPILPSPRAATPTSILAPTTAPREFVDLNFGALSARTKGLNGIEAGRVYAVYVGNWIRVSGQIDDATPAGNTGPIVARFQAPTRNAGTVYMTFDRAKWADRLGAMSRGDTLIASCRIELVQQNGMSLGDCEVQ